MSFDELLEGDDLDLEQPPPVVDDDLARRVLARRNRRLRELAAFEAEWERTMEPLLLHRKQVVERIGAEVDRCESLLADMLEARRVDDPKLTTVHLPGGTLRSKPQQPEWDYDDAEFAAWARDADRFDLLRPSYAPRKNAVKTSVILPSGKPGQSVAPVTSDGEVVGGVKVTFRPRKLVIES